MCIPRLCGAWPGPSCRSGPGCWPGRWPWPVRRRTAIDSLNRWRWPRPSTRAACLVSIAWAMSSPVSTVWMCLSMAATATAVHCASTWLKGWARRPASRPRTPSCLTCGRIWSRSWASANAPASTSWRPGRRPCSISHACGWTSACRRRNATMSRGATSIPRSTMPVTAWVSSTTASASITPIPPRPAAVRSTVLPTAA